MTKRPDDPPDAPESLPRHDPATVTRDVSPLLTLEPSSIGNVGENSTGLTEVEANPNNDPLLGTIALGCSHAVL